MEDIVIEDKYVKEFSNLSLEELKKCKALASSSEEAFTFTARYKHRDRERQKLRGVRAIRSHPLVFVLSVKFQSEDKSAAIYGTISAEYKRLNENIVIDLFSHKSNDAQFVGTGGDLALKGSCYTYGRDHACIPLRESSIVVELKLYDEAKGKDIDFAKKCFQLDVEIKDDGYEVVKSESIPWEQGAGNLTLQYIVIPFGVSCCIDIFVYHRHPPKEDYSFDVSGRISVKYENTYGSYSSEECVLFDKRGKEHETVNRGESLQLSRCWVTLPAYSSLLVDIDLSKFGSDKKIVEGTIMLHPQQGGASDDSIVLDDYIITADAAWFPPDYHWRHHPSEIIPTRSEDTEGKDESTDDVFDNGLSSNASPQRDQPPPFHAVEIFSVFIGRKESTQVNGSAEVLSNDEIVRSKESTQVYGSAEVLSNDEIVRSEESTQVYGSAEVLSNDEIVRSIFKRDNNDAFTLAQHVKFIPVLDVSRVFWNFKPLEMKVDIKDVKPLEKVDIKDAQSSLAIKGYGDWGTHILDDALCYDRQLCSLVRGKHGFAAVHYSIFSTAVVANIKVILEFKSVPADTNLSVWGSLIAQYSCFDYSSKYHKDCYRSVLFSRAKNDPVQLGVDHSILIPHSRSVIVVPSYSTLVVDVDLSFGTFAVETQVEVIKQKESKTKVICEETCDYILRIEVDWERIKMK